MRIKDLQSRGISEIQHRGFKDINQRHIKMGDSMEISGIG